MNDGLWIDVSLIVVKSKTTGLKSRIYMLVLWDGCHAN